jgi:hypothetical protein
MPASVPYSVVHAESLVGVSLFLTAYAFSKSLMFREQLFTCIFVRNSEKPNLSDLARVTVKTGMGGRYGNKGAICARLVVDDSSICFMNCHLAVGSEILHHRPSSKLTCFLVRPGSELRDSATKILSISSRTSLPSYNLLQPFPECTLADLVIPSLSMKSASYRELLECQWRNNAETSVCRGDLNYRIDLPRSIVKANIRSNNLRLLLEHDQLLKELNTNQTFRLRSFREAEITFPPTYKFDPGTDEYDSSEKERVPAWCDRIMYRASPGGASTSGDPNKASESTSKVKPLEYRSWPANPSDHKPITGLFQVRVKKMNPDHRSKIWQQAEADWNNKERKLMEKAKRYYC